MITVNEKWLPFCIFFWVWLLIHLFSKKNCICTHSLHSPRVTVGQDPPDTATIYILHSECCFSLLNSYNKQRGFKTAILYFPFWTAVFASWVFMELCPMQRPENLAKNFPFPKCLRVQTKRRRNGNKMQWAKNSQHWVKNINCGNTYRIEKQTQEKENIQKMTQKNFDGQPTFTIKPLVTTIIWTL